MDEIAEQRANENERPRRNAHLALQRHHLAATIKRQSLCLPRLHATIEDAKRGESACLEFLRSLARAIARAANQNAFVLACCKLRDFAGIQLAERMQNRTLDVSLLKFSRRT